MKNQSVVKRIVIAFMVVIMVAGMASADTVKDQYDNALALYNEGQLSSAILIFREIVDNSKTHSLADNAQYWIGEAYFRLKHFEQAIVEFDRVLTFKNTNKREDSLYKLASCHERLGKADAAMELYTRLLAEYPNTRHSSYVLKKLNLLGS